MLSSALREADKLTDLNVGFKGTPNVKVRLSRKSPSFHDIKLKYLHNFGGKSS